MPLRTKQTLRQATRRLIATRSSFASGFFEKGVCVFAWAVAQQLERWPRTE
jgi:hypothetical protein